jgi:lipoprotein-anchoring transpeptidase ErfK/SrfK
MALTALFFLTLLLLGGCTQTFLPRSTDAQAAAEAEPEPEATEVADTAIPEPQEDPAPGKLFEWNGNGRSISHVVIDTNEQRARFYDGKEQVGWTTIASGKSSHPTPRGEFEVIEKVAKKRSNLYGRIYDANGNLHKRGAHSGKDKVPAGGKFVGASMPHFMRMTYDGIGMHAGPIPRPGHPASHGCIRLPKEVASNLFAHVGLGTRVTVVGNGPDYGNYAQRVREQREQERISRIAEAEAERSATSTLASPSTSNRPRPAPRSRSTTATQPEPRTATYQADASPVVATAAVASPVEQDNAGREASTNTSAAASSADASGTTASAPSAIASGSSPNEQASGATRIMERSIPVPVTPQNQASAATATTSPVSADTSTVSDSAESTVPAAAPAEQGTGASGGAQMPATDSTPKTESAAPPAAGGDATSSSAGPSTPASESSAPTSQQSIPEPSQAAESALSSGEREQEQAAKAA